MSHGHRQLWYDYEFQTRPQTAPDSGQLARHPQMKNGNTCLLPTSQKIETIFNFFLIIQNMRASSENYQKPQSGGA